MKMKTGYDCREYAVRYEQLAIEDPVGKKSYLEVAQTWRELADMLDRLPKTKNGLDDIN